MLLKIPQCNVSPLIECKNYSYKSLHQSAIEQNDGDSQVSEIAIYCSQQCKQRGGFITRIVNTCKNEKQDRQGTKLDKLQTVIQELFLNQIQYNNEKI